MTENKTQYKVILEKGNYEAIWSLVIFNILIWVGASGMALIYRIISSLFFSATSIFLIPEKMEFEEDHISYRLTRLKKEWLIKYENVITADLDFAYNNRSGDDYTATIKYYNKRKKIKKKSMTFALEKTAKQLCVLLFDKGVDITTNDTDLQKIIYWKKKGNYYLKDND